MTKTKTVLYEKNLTVAWGDMDALGHINNVRYFDYFQEARIEWLQTQGITMQQTTGPVVIQADCTFLKPVVYPAILKLICSIHSPGRSSFIVDYDLLQASELVAKGSSKIVWVDYQQNKSILLPDAIRNLLV